MKSPRALIIGMVWPEPNSSAAGTRMLQLMGLLHQNGFEITFASAAADSEFAFDVSRIGVAKVSILLNDPSFDVFVKTENPEIVLFDRFVTEEQFGWRVAENCPDALRILDTEDLHFLRLARQLAFKENREFLKEDLFSDTAKREIASILRCDLSLIISESEMELLQNNFKIDVSLLHYLPFLVAEIDAATIQTWPLYSNRKDFIFVGNFLHEPNWNAVQYLKETIWPRIRKSLPDVSMQVYGAYASQKVLQLHKPAEKFFINGRAEDAAIVVKKARVVLAPIRFGAGAKGKLLEAMQCGTPSITTTIGAESMAGNLQWNGSVANDPDEITQAAIALYTNENLWKQSQENGIEIVNTRYSKSIFEPGFCDRIFELQTNLIKHRQQNFIGSILQHHLLASTKYLSRWIETKNSKH